MFTSSLGILLIMSVTIVGSIWLERYRWASFIGSGFLVLLLSAVAVNMGIIPPVSSGAEIYTIVFHDIAPLSIFYVLLSVRLITLKRAGKSMLLLFLTGSLATIAGVFMALQLPGAELLMGDAPHALAGMFTATYIGGGMNFNAVALHYGISEQGTLFVAATVADNILSAVWVMATLVLPRWLNKKLPIAKEDMGNNHSEAEAEIQTDMEYTIQLKQLFILLLAGLGSMALADFLNSLLPAIPSILWLTTLALVLAQLTYFHKMEAHTLLGLAGIYVLLSAIGASCDIIALWQNKEVAVFLLMFVVCIVMVHAIILFTTGYLLRKDWDYTAIASQANIGGTVTAMALAKSLGRNDLVLPAILMGSLGNALGTYAGIAVATLLTP